MEYTPAILLRQLAESYFLMEPSTKEEREAVQFYKNEVQIAYIQYSFNRCLHSYVHTMHVHYIYHSAIMHAVDYD